MSLLLVKRLVPTELIIFKSLFRDRRVIFNRSGKQKAFSPPGVQLSALYPSLLPTDEPTVTMFLHGPGDVATLEVPDSPLAMQAKNWRLGSDINDIRIGSPYHDMRDGDYAVMEFHGEGVPASVDVFLVSAHYDGDGEILRALRALHDRYGPHRPGFNVHPVDLLAELDRAEIPPGNRLLRRLLAEPTDVLREDAAAGDQDAAAMLAALGQGMDRTQFDAWRHGREITGRRGEEVYRDHLKALSDARLIRSFVWVSDTNPGSPFDFEVTMPDGKVRRVEVKSTKRSFMIPMYFSRRELRTAATNGHIYDVVRIFGLDEPRPLLRSAKDVRLNVKKLMAAVACPDGMQPENFRVEPRLFKFGDEEVALPAPPALAAE